MEGEAGAGRLVSEVNAKLSETYEIFRTSSL